MKGMPNQAYLIQETHSLTKVILLKLLINSKNLEILVYGLGIIVNYKQNSNVNELITVI